MVQTWCIDDGNIDCAGKGSSHVRMSKASAKDFDENDIDELPEDEDDDNSKTTSAEEGEDAEEASDDSGDGDNTKRKIELNTSGGRGSLHHWTVC